MPNFSPEEYYILLDTGNIIFQGPEKEALRIGKKLKCIYIKASFIMSGGCMSEKLIYKRDDPMINIRGVWYFNTREAARAWANGHNYPEGTRIISLSLGYVIQFPNDKLFGIRPGHTDSE